MCKYSNYGRLKSDQRKPPLFWSTQLITSGERINRLSCVFYESLSGHCSRQSISVPLLLWSVDQRGDICESLNIVDDIELYVKPYRLNRLFSYTQTESFVIRPGQKIPLCSII